jgi:hypothetical protein
MRNNKMKSRRNASQERGQGAFLLETKMFSDPFAG